MRKSSNNIFSKDRDKFGAIGRDTDLWCDKNVDVAISSVKTSHCCIALLGILNFETLYSYPVHKISINF